MRKRYKLPFKKEVIAYYRKYGLIKTEKDYCVSQVTILNWYRAYNYHGEHGLIPKRPMMYTHEQKQRIINFYRAHGLTATEEKYRVNHSTFIRWLKTSHKPDGDDMDSDKKYTPDNLKDEAKYKELVEELEYLRVENKLLKKLRALTQEETEE